jgi:hypothetical protein
MTKKTKKMWLGGISRVSLEGAAREFHDLGQLEIKVEDDHLMITGEALVTQEKSDGVESYIQRGVAYFGIRGRRYGFNLEDVAPDQREWLVRVVANIILEVDKRAALKATHAIQDGVAHLLGLKLTRN